MKRVTIQDIAKEMGLSRNTVAKALSNGNVSPETRQAVVQKACQMGYAKLDDALVEEVMHQKKKNRRRNNTCIVQPLAVPVLEYHIGRHQRWSQAGRLSHAALYCERG